MKKIFLLIFFLGCFLTSKVQVADSSFRAADSLHIDTSLSNTKSITANIMVLLKRNIYLNNNLPAQSYKIGKRNPVNKNDIFYLLFSLVFLLAICKTFYSRYFSNMFRVFFNSSLRQSQLTDQLIQEKIPSLFFNVLFIAVSAIYFSLLFNRYYGNDRFFNWNIFALTSLSLIIIYFIKFLSLRFIGWISGYKQEADIYIFIIFLINKIIGICLVPILLIAAFSENVLSDIAVLLSFILIGLMLLMRLFRSYGLLQHRLNVNRFHFLLYIIAMELLPIALIYKAGLMFVTKIL